MNKPTILVVEDDVPVRNLITTTLKTHDYKYLTAPTENKLVAVCGEFSGRPLNKGRKCGRINHLLGTFFRQKFYGTV